MRTAVLILLALGTEARRSSIQKHNKLDEEHPECLSIPTFPGKCPIELHPGACYRTDGQMWSCWADWEWKTDADCQMMTLNDELVGFEGACEYRDFGRRMAPEDVPDCFDIEECLAECHPVTDKWGACFVDDKADVDRAERCLCAPNTEDKTFAETLLLNGCKTKQIGYMDKAYTGLCLFPDGEDRIQPVYKCETIPYYHARNSAVACNPGVGNNFACFSVQRGKAWQCGMHTNPNPSCRTTLINPAGPPFYDGACIYEGTPGYEDALSYEEP